MLGAEPGIHAPPRALCHACYSSTSDGGNSPSAPAYWSLSLRAMLDHTLAPAAQQPQTLGFDPF